MKREIEKWEGKGGFERYLQWQGEAHRHYEISVKEVLHKNFESIWAFLRLSVLLNLLALHPFESIYSRASKYFWTERLRRVFTFGTMYMGMSPFDAPGTYSLLQYTEWAEGIWYPVGGFHVVIQALVRICERMGVDIKLETPVASVTMTGDGKTATGVLLESGEELTADIVVVNADLVYAYKNFFPSQPQSYAQALNKREQSCSSISFYWSLSEQVSQLKTHNIFLANDYRSSFDSIFKDKSIPQEPSFYVNVPSRIDSTAAPPGKDAFVVLVPVGHLLRSSNNSSAPSASSGGIPIRQDWSQIVNTARRTILSTISSRLGVDISSLIIHESLNDPLTWESTFNLDKGSILGLSHSFFNVLAFRPKTRHQSVKNCYFVGASTHPGTGVPIVLAGSKITTEQILRDLNLNVSWKGKEAMINVEGVRQDGKTWELDKLQRPWSWAMWAMVLLLVAWLSGWFTADSIRLLR